MLFSFLRLAILPLLCALVSASAQAGDSEVPGAGPSQVRIVQEDGRYQLRVNGEPFFIKGAGLANGEQEALAARGGNSFRTWGSSEDASTVVAMLDRARRNGLMVAMGIAVGSERHGFDYDDRTAVAEQLQRIRTEVLRYKDHPAVLMWVVGNELNLEYANPAVWDAVGRIADMIHGVDPNHPVMTTLAGFDPPLIAHLKKRAASLDLIGIQLYGDISALPEKLRASRWTGPYVVTEWGPTGHWESPLTSWDAAIEDDSSRKAMLLVDRYRRYIASDTRQCLGSYVFLWGDKQERTPTWYGLFLASGEATPGVDAMQYLWTERWPDDRAPSIVPIRIDGRTATESLALRPGHRYEARVQAEDSDGDRMAYRWKVLEESTAKSIGGDAEDVPPPVAVRMEGDEAGRLRFTAPDRPGAYRLFVEVHDGHGHAAYANFPFRVEDTQ